MFWFSAQAVWVDNLPQTKIFAVILEENTDGDGERLEIQDADGTDFNAKYCLVVATGHLTCDGIASWHLVNKVLQLTLSAAAADALGIPRLVEIAIQTTNGIIPKLTDGLRRILRMAPIVASAKMIGTESRQ